jgi:hypothetical protein
VDQAQYLYLRNISEPRENSLLLMVQEAIGNHAAPGPIDIPLFLSEILKDASPVESTECCRTFELYWKRYAAYLVTKECVGSCAEKEDQVYTGKLLRHYTKSHFLDYLARETDGHVTPVQHYRLICLDHLIDVGADGPPEIRIITGEMPTCNKIQ